MDRSLLFHVEELNVVARRVTRCALPPSPAPSVRSLRSCAHRRDKVGNPSRPLFSAWPAAVLLKRHARTQLCQATLFRKRS
eukprot:6468557-Amphidinium_carterae.2